MPLRRRSFRPSRFVQAVAATIAARFGPVSQRSQSCKGGAGVVVERMPIGFQRGPSKVDIRRAESMFRSSHAARTPRETIARQPAVCKKPIAPRIGVLQ